ncbi:hypothetical protein LCL95_02865 [Bacillus timonensis]|nr:hypothetical protein [Bacillus timonensis]
MLFYKDLKQWFVNSRGISLDHIEFKSLFFTSNTTTEKGLYIPLESITDNSLKEAINNGAIAALWEIEIPIPRYVPNHFPIFFVDDLKKSTFLIMKNYIDLLENERKEAHSIVKVNLPNIIGENMCLDSTFLEKMRKIEIELSLVSNAGGRE